MSRDTFPNSSIRLRPTALFEFARDFDEATRPLQSGLGSLSALAYVSATVDAARWCVGLDVEAGVLPLQRAPFFQLGLLDHGFVR